MPSEVAAPILLAQHVHLEQADIPTAWSGSSCRACIDRCGQSPTQSPPIALQIDVIARAAGVAPAAGCHRFDGGRMSVALDGPDGHLPIAQWILPRIAGMSPSQCCSKRRSMEGEPFAYEMLSITNQPVASLQPRPCPYQCARRHRVVEWVTQQIAVIPRLRLLQRVHSLELSSPALVALDVDGKPRTDGRHSEFRVGLCIGV